MKLHNPYHTPCKATISDTYPDVELSDFSLCSKTKLIRYHKCPTDSVCCVTWKQTLWYSFREWSIFGFNVLVAVLCCLRISHHRTNHGADYVQDSPSQSLWMLVILSVISESSCSSSAFPSFISGVRHFGWWILLGDECQDLLSSCDGMHGCTD